MPKHQLRARKPDLLDKLNTLRNARRLAYENNESEKVSEINIAVMAFRLQCGWEDKDATAEFHENEILYKKPFAKITGNGRIKYDIVDINAYPMGLNLSIENFSAYKTGLEVGLSHDKALLRATV